MTVNEELRTEAETIDKIIPQVQVYALPAYLANVARVFVTSAHDVREPGLRDSRGPHAFRYFLGKDPWVQKYSAF